LSGSIDVRREAWSGSDRPIARTVARPMVRFLAQESASGVLLVLATAAALLWRNSPVGDSYVEFWHTVISLEIGSLHIEDDLAHLVNDGLMVLFFFVVGLEIKTEMVMGDLRNPRDAALPAVAALGGMVVPALLFLAVNAGGPGADGWGVPMAADIAFAVGVLALLGDRIPQRLKLFVLTLAIVDDIGAIVVIALFYTSGLRADWLLVAAGGLALVVALQRARVWYTPIYVVLGVVVWFATFESGVHATIAGVALGLLAPARPLLGDRRLEFIDEVMSGHSADPIEARNTKWHVREHVSVTSRQIALLSPWTSFVIVPVFALANAGIPLSGQIVGDALGSNITWGIVAGLVLGKPIGIVAATWLAVRFGLSPLPAGVTLRHVLGAGAVAGIGFTVALFISGLAFEGTGLGDQAIIGVLLASVFATAAGAAILGRASAVRPAVDPTPGGITPVPAGAH